MKNLILMTVLAVGLCADGLAAAKTEYASISLCAPGSSKNPVPKNEVLVLVIEGPMLSYDAKPIPAAGVVETVNDLLKINQASYVGVYTREGIKYGDVVRALDVLRQTTAKNIGVSMSELPAGREL
jgi:biopolymer transport protein ExbD